MAKRHNYQEPAERKAMPMIVEGIENEREVVALNALFGNVDEGADVLHPGAFAKTIDERFHRVRVLWQHDSWLPPIGVPMWAKEVGREELPEEVRGRFPEALGGLMTKIEYLNTERGREVLTGIKAGAINENSIGYDPVVSDFEEDDNRGITVRNLREVRLWDLSPVNWGMNEGAVTLGFKAVVSYQDLPLADTDRAWDRTAAERRVRAWATGADDEVDWPKYRKAHVLYDRSDPEKFGGYKLLIADVIDDRLTAVPRGIFAAAGALMGARGGVAEFDDGDIEGAKRHLGRYYRKLDRTPPWEDEEKAAAWALVVAALNEPEPAQVQAVMEELKAGLAFSAGGIAALTALLEAAGQIGEPEDEDEPGDGKDRPLAVNPLAVMQWRLRLAELENIL